VDSRPFSPAVAARPDRETADDGRRGAAMMRRTAAVAAPASAEASGAADAALVRRAAAGERAALAQLYDQYVPAGYSLAGRFVGAAAAEDLIHDLFLALLERPGLYDPARGSFRAWFMTAVHHRCLNVLRSRGRQTGDAALAALPDPEPEPAETVVRRLEDATVRAALEGLPEAQREALVLAYYGGLSQSALAEKLAVPLGTVKARMRRGLLALRAALQGEGMGATGEEAGG
jgi:RNA polymerase sigma-70 factor (ECF subfamily)